jgi:hypothetical protein
MVGWEMNDERIKLLEAEVDEEVGDGGSSDGDGDGYECISSFVEGMKKVQI